MGAVSVVKCKGHPDMSAPPIPVSGFELEREVVRVLSAVLSVHVYNVISSCPAQGFSTRPPPCSAPETISFLSGETTSSAVGQARTSA